MKFASTERWVIAAVVGGALAAMARLYHIPNPHSSATLFSLAFSLVVYVAFYAMWHSRVLAANDRDQRDHEKKHPRNGVDSDKSQSDKDGAKRPSRTISKPHNRVKRLLAAYVLGIMLLHAIGYVWSIRKFNPSGVAGIVYFGLPVLAAVAFCLWYFYPDDFREPYVKPERIQDESAENAASAAQSQMHELLETEYEKAAERFENIYKAVWQNFSYMTVVSAGILTFGSKGLSTPVLGFVAITPLLFWFIATFVPMDHYGQQVRTRLRNIEETLSELSGDPALLRHFVNFHDRPFVWGVGDAVRAFGAALVFCWLVSFCFAMSRIVQRDILLHPTENARTLSPDAEGKYYFVTPVTKPGLERTAPRMVN